MIGFFQTAYTWLNNGYPTAIRVNEIIYPNAWAAYLSEKTSNPEIKMDLSNSDDKTLPVVAHRIGEPLKGFEPSQIMAKILRIKFGLTLAGDNIAEKMILAKKLVSTDLDKLEFGNYGCETYWGKCYCSRHKKFVEGSHVPTGLNELGTVLMAIRDEWRTYIEETNEISINCINCNDDAEHYYLYMQNQK